MAVQPLQSDATLEMAGILAIVGNSVIFTQFSKTDDTFTPLLPASRPLPSLSNSPCGKLPSDSQPLKSPLKLVDFVKGSSNPAGIDSNAAQVLKIIAALVTSV